MPNHVHLILAPADDDGLRRTAGHLWFGSVTLDEARLVNAVRYVTLNPARAWIAALERRTGRRLAPGRPGRKPRKKRGLCKLSP